MTITRISTRKITEYVFRLQDDEGRNVGDVVITFENDKFKKCTFPFHASYTREQWCVLAEIESEICDIERSLSK